jgi:hypothetical protein
MIISLNRLLSFGLLCLVLVSCQSSPKKESSPMPDKVIKPVETNPEDAVVNLIMNLEEVKRKGIEVSRVSKGKRHLVGYVETSPTKVDPQYWVKVGEDNGDSYVAYYTFAVHSKTRDIRYYDPIQDSLMTIEEWRTKTPVSER